MEFTIHELPDGKATLMTSDGLYLFTFRDLETATKACEDWYHRHADEAVETGGGVSCSVCS
jgi:hypothetical protein